MTGAQRTAAWAARLASAGARHRSPGPACTTAFPDTFEPRHCNGETCFHDHAPGNVRDYVTHLRDTGRPGRALAVQTRHELRALNGAAAAVGRAMQRGTETSWRAGSRTQLTNH